MKNFKSFEEMGAFMGIHRKEPEVKSGRICYSCQGKMSIIPGTNIFRCTKCGKTTICSAK